MKLININNTNVYYENNQATPRAAIVLYFMPDVKPSFDGVNYILGNLLLQGTKTRTAEQIAQELENLGIELNVESYIDYLSVSLLCMNEDIEKALDILNDIMQNSTFENFDKEVYKFKGETIASLDSPITKTWSEFNAKLYEGHKYALCAAKFLDKVDLLKKEHVVNQFETLLNSPRLISIAASMDNEEEFINLVTKKLPFMANSKKSSLIKDNLIHYNSGLTKIEKNDAQQAQILRGWIVPSQNSPDYPKFCVLDSILGGSGLSSRLFVELRDKRGLAYSVRSTYKTMVHAAHFALYIGTEPSNIQKSLKGFDDEIQRLIDEPPTDEELKGGIESCIGNRYMNTQTNIQIAEFSGFNVISGLGEDFYDNTLNKLKKVTSDDIVEMTKKYLLKPSVTVVMAKGEYLNF